MLKFGRGVGCIPLCYEEQKANMELATEIVKFFDVNNFPLLDGKPSFQSLGDFNSKHSNLNLMELTSTANKLESEGILFKVMSKDMTLLGPCYISKIQSRQNEDYGAYESLCRGFLHIRAKYKSSIFPVIATKQDGSFDIGTSFYFQTKKGYYVATAFHCLKNMNEVKIRIEENVYIRPKRIIKSLNANVDIAVIEIDKLKSNYLPLWVGESEILDEVLTLGFPPIAGFDAFVVSDVSTINSNVKSSTGKILGKEFSYLDKLDFILLNARIKGGNSGSPIINKMGYVTGIIVNLLQDPKDQSKLDDLGYGLALSSDQLTKLANFENATDLKYQQFKEGFKI